MKFTTATFKPLEAGDYSATITSVSEGQWPSGDPYLEVIFSLENPETLSTIHIPARVNPVISKNPKYKLFGELLTILDKGHELEGEFDPMELDMKEVIISTILEDDRNDPEKKWSRVVSVKKKA
jgi:hypothetical protein